jgi:hypothetical protein
MSSESGGEGGSRRVSFGSESVVGNHVRVQEQPLRPDVATARLSLEPQQSTTGRESFAGLSKTPILPVAGSTSVSNSITPAAVVTATPGSNGPVVSPAAIAAILAGVAPAPKRDEQLNVLLLQNMILQWSFLCAR